MAEPTIPSDPTVDLDMAYDLKRAGEERARALGSTNMWARAAHHELALAYEHRAWRRDADLVSTLRVGSGKG